MLEAPCEEVVKKYIPALRSAVALLLVREYGMPLYRVAKLLGLTPAAISNYLKGVRGNMIPFETIAKSPAGQYVKKIAELMVENNNASRDYALLLLCKACSALREYLEGVKPPCGRV
ncbi:MAG: hypothetical protein ABWW69_06280 [Pyrodictiaceae archaeon]